MTEIAIKNQNQHIGEIHWDDEYASFPRVGDCLIVATDDNDWTNHYKIVDFMWQVYPHKVNKYPEGKEKYLGSDWKDILPAEIVVTYCGCDEKWDDAETRPINFRDEPTLSLVPGRKQHDQH